MTLSEYLKKNNLTQADMARALNVSPMAMNYYIRNKRRPSVDVVKNIYALTNGAVTANDFYGLSEEMED